MRARLHTAPSEKRNSDAIPPRPFHEKVNLSENQVERPDPLSANLYRTSETDSDVCTDPSECHDPVRDPSHFRYCPAVRE